MCWALMTYYMCEVTERSALPKFPKVITQPEWVDALYAISLNYPTSPGFPYQYEDMLTLWKHRKIQYADKHGVPPESVQKWWAENNFETKRLHETSKSLQTLVKITQSETENHLQEKLTVLKPKSVINLSKMNKL